MDFAEPLTHWTVRLALTLYVLGLMLRVRAAGRRSWESLGRVVWTAGCLALMLHMVCALQFYHHWSHTTEARASATSAGLWQWSSGFFAVREENEIGDPVKILHGPRCSDSPTTRRARNSTSRPVVRACLAGPS